MEVCRAGFRARTPNIEGGCQGTEEQGETTAGKGRGPRNPKGSAARRRAAGVRSVLRTRLPALHLGAPLDVGPESPRGLVAARVSGAGSQESPAPRARPRGARARPARRQPFPGSSPLPSSGPRAPSAPPQGCARLLARAR